MSHLATADDLFFRRAGLDLPRTQRCEQREKKNAGEGEQRQRRRGTRSPGRVGQRPAQGMLRISCMDAGIMLLFMWNITHSDPLRVITTSTMVKISASMFQPPCEWAFRCRK